MDQTNLLCHKMKIPETLDHLMYCLTKEILCKQPDNVYEFSTKFFHQLVEERDGTSRTSFVESSKSRPIKPNSISIIDAGRGYGGQLNEEGEITDDFDKELQQLNDDILGADDMSPPPTLDDSMSDNDTSLPKIAAVVTSKTRESPRSAIGSSVSRTARAVAPEDIEEAINAFTNEAFQEGALDLKPDASPDAFTEESDEKPLAVADTQSTAEDLGEPETALTTTEEPPDVTLTDSDGIEETVDLEPHEEAARMEEDLPNENANEEEQAAAEMVDVGDLPMPEVEGETSVNEELLNSPLEDLSEANETKVDESENTEMAVNPIGESENAANEPADSIESSNDPPVSADVPTDFDGITEEIVHLEEQETVNGSETVENELQEDVDSSTPEAEGETTENIEISNSLQLENEIEADGVENQEILVDQAEESDNAAASPTDLQELNNGEEQPADTEETGSNSGANVEDELILQEHDQEVKPSESSDFEEQIQEENETIDVDECKEGNDVDITVTENEGHDEDEKELDEKEGFTSESEGIVVSDAVDEHSNQIESAEEVLPGVECEDMLEGTEACETQHDGDLLHANENSFVEVEDTGRNSPQASEDNTLAEENADQDNRLEDLMEEATQEDDGGFHDMEENDEIVKDANETAVDAEQASAEGEENLQQNHDPSTSPMAESDGNDNQLPKSDLENDMTDVDPPLEVEDTGNKEENGSISEHTEPEIGPEDDGEIKADSEMAESEILNPVSEVPEDTDLIQEEKDSTSLSENVEDGTGFNALSFTGNVADNESPIEKEPESEPNDTTELDNQQPTPDLKGNVCLDEEFNELLHEGDKEVSNDDEEEIWSKLQKDLQLEEEEQRNLAAIKIQSTFRGYQSRKEQSMLENKITTEDENDHVGDEVENIPDDQVSILTGSPEEPLENDDDDKGLTGALAGVTESIATVAMIMTDTAQSEPPLIHTGEDRHEDELDRNLESENATDTINAFLTDHREVNDVAEEPMSNGEEIRNIQLIESYVITSSVADNSESPESQEATNIENSQENGSTSFKVNDDSTDEIGTTEAETVASDPGVVFELYVESNETTNDGLLESSCTFQQDQLDRSLLEKENFAATKIQAGFRGHQDRKRVRHLKHDIIENVTPAGIDVDNTEELENAAATKIQAGFRGHQDRKRIKDGKYHAAGIGGTDQINLNITEEKRHSSQQMAQDPCSIELENAAATKIQAGFRGHQDRKRIKHMQQRITENDVIENDGALGINAISADDQSNVERSQEDLCMEELENAAATKIQASFRGYQDRKNTKHLKNNPTQDNLIKIEETRLAEEDDLLERDEINQQVGQYSLENENAAATKIQAGFRGQQDRKRVKHLKESTIKSDVVDNDAVGSKEQALLLDYDQSAEATQVDLENAAATKIQAGFRGHQDRKKVKNLQHQIAENNDVENESKQCIDNISASNQSNVERSQENLSLEELENAAATKIQASFRGYQDRKNTKHLKNHTAPVDVISTEKTNPVGEDYSFDPSEPIEQIERNELEKENIAATKIQAGYRGHQDRKRVKCLKDSMINSDVVDSVGAKFNEEASLLNNDQSAESIQIDLENAAATTIQAGFRGHQERKRVKNLQNPISENDIAEDYSKPCTDTISVPEQSDIEPSQENLCLEELENAAATKIQASFRGYQDRKNMKHLKNNATSSDLINIEDDVNFVGENCLFDGGETIQPIGRNSFEEENIAATKIQAGFRGRQDRKRVKDLKNSIVKSDGADARYNEEASLLNSDQSAEAIQVELENIAATKIQAGFRGHQDRKRVKNLQHQIAENDDAENERASCMDTITTLDPSTIEKNQETLSLKELEDAAATKIQASFRGYQDRKNIKHLQKRATLNDLNKENETNFVEENCLFDGDEPLEQIRRNSLEEENAAATKIQAGFRGNQDRKRVKDLKDSIMKSDLENAAATKIQARVRGHQDRKRVKNLQNCTDEAE